MTAVKAMPEGFQKHAEKYWTLSEGLSKKKAVLEFTLRLIGSFREGAFKEYSRM